MNKNEFLSELNNLLGALSPNDRRNALQYYIEYFEDAGVENEQRVILELGSPEETAKLILEEYSIPSEPQPNPAQSMAKAADAVKSTATKVKSQAELVSGKIKSKNLFEKSKSLLKKVTAVIFKIFKNLLKLLIILICFFTFALGAVFTTAFVALLLAFGIAAVLCGLIGAAAFIGVIFSDIATGSLGLGASFIISALGILIGILGYNACFWDIKLLKKMKDFFINRIIKRRKTNETEN